MIRQGEPRDVERVYNIVTQFIDNAKFWCIHLVDKTKAYKFISEVLPTSFIAEEGGKITGMVAGYITTYMLSEDKVYQTVFWWVDKEHKEVSLKLYNALEQACKVTGVKYLVMAHLWDESVHLERFYNMHGFRKLETHYIREIK